MRLALAFATAALLIAGCSPAAPEPAPSRTPSASAGDHDGEVIEVPSQVATPTVPAGPTLKGPIERASAETIAPDPGLMATMECEPLSDETLEGLARVYGPPVMEPVQVLIGEGLTPGENWWVVVTDTDWERAQGNNQWLTNQPGLTSGQGKWINIGSMMRLPDGSWGSSFDGVHWDYERLARGRAALTKAFECLAR